MPPSHLPCGQKPGGHCSLVLTQLYSQRITKVYQSTSKIQPESIPFLSKSLLSFFCCIRYPINLSRSFFQIQPRLVALHVCGAQLTSWNFFFITLMDAFFSLLYQILYYLCPFTFTFLVLVEASSSIFLRKLLRTVYRR